MRLSVSIMAHPDRADHVAELRHRLTGAGEIPVYWDSEGPPSGNSDRVWRTARGGWGLHDPEADFHLLLQDDAIPCDDLIVGLAHALLEVPPDAIVSPYLGRGGATPHTWRRMAEQADRVGASWVVSTKLMWGVGIVLPVSRIPDMILMADRMTGVPDDMRVAGWATRRKIDVWYTWPSLIDHRTVPSLTKHRAKDRVAERHHSGSATEINFSGPVVRDPMLVRLRGQRSGPRRARL